MPHFPMGSKQDLIEHGLSLVEHGHCGPKAVDANGRTIRGCPFRDKLDYNGQPACRFADPRYGGFMDTRPHMIGYYLRLWSGDGAAAKMDTCACFEWHASGLDDRFRAQAETKEKLMIVAQEGDFIQIRESIPVDPNNNKTGDVRMKTVIHKHDKAKDRCACGEAKCTRYIVPRFPTIDEQLPSLEFEADLEAIVKQRERDAALLEAGSGEG